MASDYKTSGMSNHATIEYPSCTFVSSSATVCTWFGQNIWQSDRPKMVDPLNFSTVFSSLATAHRSFLYTQSVWLIAYKRNADGQSHVNMLPELRFLVKNQLPTQAPLWIQVPGNDQLHPHSWKDALPFLVCFTSLIASLIRSVGGLSKYFYQGPMKHETSARCRASRSVKQSMPFQTAPFALYSSWANTCHVTFEDVLSTALWLSAGVFQINYLQDMALISNEMSVLGPLVAAWLIGATEFTHPSTYLKFPLTY